MNEEDLRKSIAYFEAALRQDPQYAMAYTGLAEAYNLCAFLGTVPASEARADPRNSPRRLSPWMTIWLERTPHSLLQNTCTSGIGKAPKKST